jgi:hypothetical protein
MGSEKSKQFSKKRYEAKLFIVPPFKERRLIISQERYFTMK